MTNPLLSIVVPVEKNKCKFLKCLFSRLSLNKALYPDHTFEIIIVDAGSTDETRALCDMISNYMNLKYIYIPVTSKTNLYIEPYLFNVGLRICQGEFVSLVKPQEWISENFIYGALNPLIDDSNFSYVFLNEQDKKEKIKNLDKKHLFQEYTEDVYDVINTALVTKSEKTPLLDNPTALSSQLLLDETLNYQILDVIDQAKLPTDKSGLDLWVTKTNRIVELGADNEAYCFYGKEHNRWEEKFKDFEIINDYPSTFCTIRLYDESPSIFSKESIVSQNNLWSWGKLVEYSYSIINGKSMIVEEHEKWIKDNIKNVPYYSGDSLSFDNHIEELQKCL